MAELRVLPLSATRWRDLETLFGANGACGGCWCMCWRVLAPVDARPVWSVSCFFIRRDWRRRGVSAALLEAALRHARKQGADLVEGYPSEPRAKTGDAFVWTGLASAFEKAGFTEVARRSPTRPIMRIGL